MAVIWVDYYDEGWMLLLPVVRRLLMGPVTMWLVMRAWPGLLMDVILDLPLGMLISLCVGPVAAVGCTVVVAGCKAAIVVADCQADVDIAN